LGKTLYLLATNYDPAQFCDFIRGALPIPGTDTRRADLESILRRACARDSCQRYQSATEMLTDVRRLVRPTVVELRIEEDFSSFPPGQREEVLSLVRQRCSSEIHVESIRPGSVIFRLKMMPDDAERLLAAVRGGWLGRFRVLDAHLLETQPMRGKE